MATPLSDAVRVPLLALALTMVCASTGAAQSAVESFADLPQVLRPGIVVFSRLRKRASPRCSETIWPVFGYR